MRIRTVGCDAAISVHDIQDPGPLAREPRVRCLAQYEMGTERASESHDGGGKGAERTQHGFLSTLALPRNTDSQQDTTVNRLCSSSAVQCPQQIRTVVPHPAVPANTMCTGDTPRVPTSCPRGIELSVAKCAPSSKPQTEFQEILAKPIRETGAQTRGVLPLETYSVPAALSRTRRQGHPTNSVPIAISPMSGDALRRARHRHSLLSRQPPDLAIARTRDETPRRRARDHDVPASRGRSRINYAYQLYKSAEWRDLFGPFRRSYRDNYRPIPFSRKYVRHMAGWYAQKHPDEDFAETFAVWLTPRSQWRKRYPVWGRAGQAPLRRSRVAQESAVSRPHPPVAGRTDITVDEIWKRRIGEFTALTTCRRRFRCRNCARCRPLPTSSTSPSSGQRRATRSTKNVWPIASQAIVVPRVRLLMERVCSVPSVKAISGVHLQAREDLGLRVDVRPESSTSRVHGVHPPALHELPHP